MAWLHTQCVHDTKAEVDSIRHLTADQLGPYLDSFHGTDHQHSLHYPSAKPTEQAPGAVQSSRLILCMVAEELKHSKPEGGNRGSGELWDGFNGALHNHHRISHNKIATWIMLQWQYLSK